MVWALGQIAPGQGVTVVLPPALAPAVVGGSALTFAARATATGGALAEASASVLAASAPRFDLALLAGADPALPGEAVEYTVMFGKGSNTTALGAVLELPLPRGATYVSSSNGGTLVGDTVTWALGDLPQRAGDVRRATVSIPAGTAAGTLLTGPAARLRDTVSPAEEARATALARVHAARALVVDVAANPDPAKPSEQTSIEVTVANRGNLAISDVVVDLRVPMEVASTAETIIEGAGDCIGAGFVTSCEAGEYLTWPVGSLQPGESRTVAYAPRIALARERRKRRDGERRRARHGRAAGERRDGVARRGPSGPRPGTRHVTQSGRSGADPRPGVFVRERGRGHAQPSTRGAAGRDARVDEQRRQERGRCLSAGT